MKLRSAARMHFGNFIRKVKRNYRRLKMGGTNQATCPPPAIPKTSKLGSKQKSKIRYHEVSSRGEVDFHDDKVGLKCAIEIATFHNEYSKWRKDMSGELVLSGNDGSGGHSNVTFIPIMDKGKMEVSMVVTKAEVGVTINDLDTLARYP